ncbi:N-formylglutamate amidohydrolase [Lichenicoccus sp.]|uniref:N-formylglutamate amidohydrolase n=1 Tax=Lichenicoccus sp. TaxID=2781899 RepID=UPI003D0F7852
MDSVVPFVLVSDHAGRAIPQSLGTLGLCDTDRARHIAWDIGVAGLGERLSDLLGATLVAQAYSRLVIDCNRRPGHPTSIASVSDSTPVPGNEGLRQDQRAAREHAIFAPYHAAIATGLDTRRAAGQPTVLVALHSFTPRLRTPSRPTPGDADGHRPWHVGVLHNHDPRFALILRDLLAAEGELVVGNNAPYALSDDDDYTVPVHGEQRGLPHVEIEIRQDLIADADGEAAWAARLARLLPLAWQLFGQRFGC